MTSALDKLNKTNLFFEDTTKKNYQRLQSWRNVTSFSMLSELHRCPRKFQLIKARAARNERSSSGENVDFAFGHSVGSGVQAYIASGGDMNVAVFNAFLAWDIAFIAAIEKKAKSIWQATLAIQKFKTFWDEHFADDWQVWVLPTGKPAVELSIAVDFENGYKHYSHIDLILEHKITKQLAVMENKTDGFKNIDESKYANSTQALSYSVLIDELREDTSYEVYYFVYSTTGGEWQMLPFTKNVSAKAEWINDVLLDHASLSTYHHLNFYPKRGESCFDFSRRCEFFGICNLTSQINTPADLPMDQEAEKVDFSFKISDIRRTQHGRNQTPVEAQDTHGASIESID